MLIEIVSDAVCPWCYIGKRRIEQAFALDPDPTRRVVWRPFQLNPDMPPEGMDRRAYLRAKFGDQAGGKMYEAVVAAGQEVGIPFDFPHIPRTPNTLSAHRLIAFSGAEGRQDQMVETLFRAYFVEGQDVSAPETLVRLAGEAGLDPEAVARHLGTDEGLAEVAAAEARVRAIGIEGVPSYIIDDAFLIVGAQAPETLVKAFHFVREQQAAAVQEA